MLHIVIQCPVWVGHEPKVYLSIVKYFLNNQSKCDSTVAAYNYNVEGRSLVCVLELFIKLEFFFGIRHSLSGGGLRHVSTLDNSDLGTIRKFKSGKNKNLCILPCTFYPMSP